MLSRAGNLVLDSISHRYGAGPTVLENISLSLAQNEIIALIGPTGCGKTTLLRLCSGLIKPLQGEIFHKQTPVDKPLHNSGFIFQEATLQPWQTTLDNATLALRLKGVGKPDSRRIARHWLEKVGLSKAESYYPRQLSGGMQMRVALARALCPEPEILFMDEPFGAVDAVTRNRLNEELLKLWQVQQCSVLFVSHAVSEAVFLAHRVVVLTGQPGRIFQEIPVPFQYPRLSELRESNRYQEKVAEVTHSLRMAEAQ